jgi:hypothetical protein
MLEFREELLVKAAGVGNLLVHFFFATKRASVWSTGSPLLCTSWDWLRGFRFELTTFGL